MNLKDFITDIIGDVVDFMVTHTEPFFGLSLLSCAVGFAVIELISDYFTGKGDFDD